MSLSETKIYDLVEVVENGIVQVREKTSILRDGVEISTAYHRWTIAPGDDFSHHPSEKIRSICEAVHTPEVIEAYRKSIASIVEIPEQQSPLSE